MARNTTSSGAQSALERFGGPAGWNDEGLFLGAAITGEGPGEGFAMVPWALDKYERALRLRPGESWLLRRFLKHAWTFGRPVFVSLRRISREAGVSRNTVSTYLKHLEELGYVHCVSDGEAFDRRKRYDVSGIYAALAICIAADPTSNWAKAHGGPIPVTQAMGLRGYATRPLFCIDFDAITGLAASESTELPDEDD